MSAPSAWTVHRNGGVDLVVLHAPLLHGAREQDRTAALGWLKRHDVDAALVVVPGWVAANSSLRQVSFLTLDRDEEGTPRIDEDGSYVKTIATVQLEGSPQPWPAHTDQGTS